MSPFPFLSATHHAMNQLPKYAEWEIERRWLVELGDIGSLDGLPCREIDDLYLDATRLRLRRVVGPAGECVWKLCKKYGKISPLAEPITNLYLSETEYQALAQLPGRRVSKRRYSLDGGALDLYAGPRPWALFEHEFASEAEASRYVPPAYARREVTGDPAYDGSALASSIG